jgi:hypothetical protein
MRRLLPLALWAVALPAFAASILVVPENDVAREVASELAEPFGKQKVKIKLAGPQAPATQCLNRAGPELARCLAQAGQTAFVDAVLQLGASTKKGRTSVTFQLLSLDEGKLIKREVATGPASNLAGALRPSIARLAKVIKPRGDANKPVEPTEPKPDPRPDPKPDLKPTVADPTPKPLTDDTPKATPLEPTELIGGPAIVQPAATGSGMTVAAWTTTGAAVASAAVAGTFGALGLTTRAELDRNEGGVSPHSRSQADALAAQANTNFSVALGAGIGAGVLGVVSAILWSQTP